MQNWTIKKLFASTVRFSSSRSTPNASPSVRLDKIIPFAGTGSALFQLTLAGVTQTNDSGIPVNHKVNVFFYNLDIKRNPIENYITVKDNTGEYWVQVPSANITPVRVRCSCHDHFFTFGLWNYKDKAIFGDKPRPYKRKTPPPPEGYPYRNPKHIPGICKHIYWAIKYLQSKKFCK